MAPSENWFMSDQNKVIFHPKVSVYKSWKSSDENRKISKILICLYSIHTKKIITDNITFRRKNSTSEGVLKSLPCFAPNVETLKDLSSTRKSVTLFNFQQLLILTSFVHNFSCTQEIGFPIWFLLVGIACICAQWLLPLVPFNCAVSAELLCKGFFI